MIARDDGIFNDILTMHLYNDFATSIKMPRGLRGIHSVTFFDF